VPGLEKRKGGKGGERSGWKKAWGGREAPARWDRKKDDRVPSGECFADDDGEKKRKQRKGKSLTLNLQKKTP